MSRLGLLLFLSLVAGPATAASRDGGPVAAACQETHDSCRSGCAMDWGASARTRDRLMRCVSRCDQDSTRCLDRALGRARGEKVEEPAPHQEVQRKRAPSRYVDRAPAKRRPSDSTGKKDQGPKNVGAPDWLDEDPAPPKRAVAPPPSPSSGSSRASDTDWADTSSGKTSPGVAAASRALPRAEAETLAPLSPGGDVDTAPDPLLPIEPDPDEGRELSRAEAEALPPLEPLPSTPAQQDRTATRAPAARTVEAHPRPSDTGSGSSLWPKKTSTSSEASRSPTGSKRPSDAQPSKGSGFKKKKDISEWDFD